MDFFFLEGYATHPGKDVKIEDFAKFKGDTCYIDMGILPNKFWSLIDWQSSPPSFDQKKLDSFMSGFFAQLKEHGINKIDLSFAQLKDIDHLVTGEGGSTGDTITMIFQQFNKYPTGTTGKNILQ